MNKIVLSLLSWLIKEFIVPFIAYLRDRSVINKQIKKDQKVLEDLNNAKKPSDIDSAIDRLP